MRLASYLSKEFRDAGLEYMRTFFDKKDEPRWKECVLEVDSTFGIVLGLVFVEEVLKKDGKQEVTRLCFHFLYFLKICFSTFG